MKLFGWKAGRAPVRPALLRGSGSWITGAWPRSYEAQLRELYLSNAIAQRAVRLVGEGLASAPLAASDDAALALVQATSGGQALLETVAMQLLLHGNAYVELLPGSGPKPAELYALRPERVTVEPDARGWPQAFLYRAGQAVTRMSPDQVIHIRTHHPLDDHYGLGCLDAAAGAMAAHNAATRWNKALLDNAARPSGALVAEGGETLSADQFARLQSEMEASFAGAANAGRPMLLEGGLRWQSLSFSPADMDFAGLKAAAAREIALAFGVPPMLLGLPGDATYANYREANKALWRQAILPLAGKILSALAEGLQPWFVGLTLAVDLDRVTALSEDRERLWAQLTGADFLTPNEKRVMVGLAAIEILDGRTAEAEPDDDKPDAVETKFNPWHDPDDGQFTFAGSGALSGGGESAAMAERPKKKARPIVAGNSRPHALAGQSRTPTQTQIGSIPGYPETGATKWRQANDRVFLDAVNAFNRENGLTPEDPRYMYAFTLKAQAMVESGGEGDKDAFLRDPLQVNNPKDWGKGEKKAAGLVDKHQLMTPATSAAAALRWLDIRGHRSDPAPGGKYVKAYLGQAYAIKRYNARTDLREDGEIYSDWYSNRIIELGQAAAADYNKLHRGKHRK